MSLEPSDIQNIAKLARIAIQPQDIAVLQKRLTDILQLVAQMQQVKTEGIEPMSHPLETGLRVRKDLVTEEIQRERYQLNAPLTEDGLYLVPKVIDQ